MNRRIFANLILYDIRKGFRENKIKWIVGVFIFVFFSFITVSDFSVNSPELGFLAYFTNILQGMPPYIKTDDSVFTIPVSWFLFYAFFIFYGRILSIVRSVWCRQKDTDIVWQQV